MMKILIHCHFAFLFMINVKTIRSNVIRTSDSCDWTGSGTLEMALSRGVQPVYLRCTQGTVRWNYPQGALRISLQHRTTGSDFKACLRRSDVNSGSRIYLTGRRKLHLVFRQEDPVDLVRCVTSRNGQVALFVEADPIADALRKTTSEFSYHLTKAEGNNRYDAYSECQPCTPEQLLKHYCSSDFVIRGTVSNLQHNSALQRSELSVSVTKIHRSNEHTMLQERALSSNSISNSDDVVVLHRNLNCGTRSGTGEYLFLGKWILGNPELTCAPRVSEWKKVRRKAIASRSNECILDL